MKATIKFIEDAVEGGWNKQDGVKFMLVNGEPFLVDMINHPFGVMPCRTIALDEIEKYLLDPKAWQAVGKVRGWEEPKECLIDGVESHCSDTYQNKARNFFQYVLDGKNIEEALQAIE